jgi:hypothetical protein
MRRHRLPTQPTSSELFSSGAMMQMMYVWG